MAAVRSASAQPWVPEGASLDDLRRAANACQGCDLYRHASQVVFSHGDTDARAVLVGEEPGDVEDRKGAVFVGPAGAVLRRAMAEVGIAPAEAYLTNAVKHFKFHTEAGSKRRLHDKPSRAEIVACRPWLRAEFALLRPQVVVALGASAASALAGPSFRVTHHRGELLPWPDTADDPSAYPRTDPPAHFVPSVHPSAVLRAEDRDAAYAEFVADLKVVASVLA